jgi:hypothetical protein
MNKPDESSSDVSITSSHQIPLPAQSFDNFMSQLGRISPSSQATMSLGRKGSIAAVTSNRLSATDLSDMGDELDDLIGLLAKRSH